MSGESREMAAEAAHVTASGPAPSGAHGRHGRVAGLDGFRGLAILLVVIAHVLGLNGAGLVGVLAFFVLSGYLITSLLLAERERLGRVDLATFYWHRALRLLPALVVFLTLFLLVAASGRSGVVMADAGRGILLALTYLTDVALTVQTGYSPELAHLWTLAVEEHFYVVWPIVLAGLMRLSNGRRLTWLLRLVFAAVMLRLITLAVAPTFGLFFYAAPTLWTECLLVGSGCAVVLRERDALATRLVGLVRRRAVIVAAVALLIGVALVPGSFTWPGTYVIGIPLLAMSAAVIVVGVGEGLAPRLAGWLSRRHLVTLGSISYALYLYNSTCIMLTQRLFGESLTARLVGLLVALALALMSRQWVEGPALRLKRRRARHIALRSGDKTAQETEVRRPRDDADGIPRW